MKYKGDWGAITAVGAYNSNWEEWAGKARLDINASKDLTLFVMAGYGTDENNGNELLQALDRQLRHLGRRQLTSSTRRPP